MYGENTVDVLRRVGYKLKIYPQLEVVADNLPSRCDPSGYVDPNVKIREAQKAGIRIEELRHAIYDYQNPDREIWREEDDDYVNMDIYKSEVELLEEGYHSLEIYRKKQRAIYDAYLENQKKTESPNPEREDSETKVSELPEVKVE